jgi:exonuclease VII small subunit
MVSIDNLRISVTLIKSQFEQAIADLKQELRDLDNLIDRIDSQALDLTTEIRYAEEIAELQEAITAMEQQEIDLDVNIKEEQLAAQIAAATALSQGVNAGDIDLGDIDLADIADADGRVGGPAMGRGQITRGLATGNLSDLNVSMADLHNAVARLVPLLLTFIGTMPAAITAMITLAGAAAAAGASLIALTGFGALGFALERRGRGDILAGLSDVADRVVDDFLDAFAPLARELAPFFADALDGLRSFFEAIADVGGSLIALTDMARGFGQFMIEFVPQALAAASALVRSFLPTMRAFGNWLQQTDITEAFVAMTSKALPAMQRLAAAIIDILPALIRVSVGFARAAGVVLTVIDAVGRVIDLLPISAEALGLVTGAALSLATAFFIANSAMLQAVAGGIMAGVTAALQKLSVAMIGGASASNIFAASLTALRAALLKLLAASVVGVLIAGVAQLAAEFLDLTGIIGGAADQLERFNEAQQTVSRGPNPYAEDELGIRSGTFSGNVGTGSVNVTVNQGNEDMRNQLNNALFRMDRTSQ